MTKKKHINDPNLKFPGTLKTRLSITKISETKVNPYGYKIGVTRTGTLYSNVKPGESLVLMYCDETKGSIYITSVIESIDFIKQTFTTINSTYSYKIIL